MVNSIKEQGRLLEKREDVRKLLDKKFGPLPQDVLAHIEALSVERLDEILLAILDAKSLDEVGLTA